MIDRKFIDVFLKFINMPIMIHNFSHLSTFSPVKILYIYNVDTYLCTAIMITFGQSSYSVNEDDGVVQPELILSNPSSSSFTAQVISKDITALSKH